MHRNRSCSQTRSVRCFQACSISWYYLLSWYATVSELLLLLFFLHTKKYQESVWLKWRKKKSDILYCIQKFNPNSTSVHDHKLSSMKHCIFFNSAVLSLLFRGPRATFFSVLEALGNWNDPNSSSVHSTELFSVLLILTTFRHGLLLRWAFLCFASWN